MSYLLILWMAGYGYSVAMQQFNTKAQCEMVGEHIKAETGNLRHYECIPLSTKTAEH